MNLVTKLFSKVAELFSDDCGRLSSMRVGTAAMVVTGIYFFWRIIDVWSTVCLAKTEFVPLNLTDFTGLIGAVAALFAKSWQKKIEAQYDSCSQFTFSEDETAPGTKASQRPPAGEQPGRPTEGEDA